MKTLKYKNKKSRNNHKNLQNKNYLARQDSSKRDKYFDIIMAIFVAVLLISNIASTKILTLGKFTFDGGTLLFPLSYILEIF